ncbi:MAG: UDP-N-acetylglucosamine 2-epimerase (non-hydrolyzing) [Anaerolineales bacterium]
MSGVTKRKVLIIFGTRPEAIKLIPVFRELERRPEQFVTRVCVTSQQREMQDQVLTLFDVRPDHDLDIMTFDQTLGQITSRMIEKLDDILSKEQPDVVLVQGDTTTAFCGALAAFYHHLKVGHVEAGLRTGNKYAPFPEEINRRLVSRLADYHFAPTEHARNTLMEEGIPPSSIFITGNTVVDALLWVRDRIRLSPPDLPEGVKELMEGNRLVLVTGHRRESFGEGLKNICYAIRQVSEEFNNVMFIFPVHLNPNVRQPVNQILGHQHHVQLIEPLPYASFIWLMDQAEIVLTDSGGVQEEAPSLGKPVLVMREETERPEGIQAGNAMLVGTQQERIVKELTHLLKNPEARLKMAKVNNPYGDGKAASRIADILTSM